MTNMKSWMTLSLLLAWVVVLAALVHGADVTEAEGHTIVKRGFTDRIVAAARSLRDGASSFFERSWSGLKSAIVDLMNWIRGVQPQQERAPGPTPGRPDGPPVYFPADRDPIDGIHSHADPEQQATTRPGRYSSTSNPSDAKKAASSTSAPTEHATTVHRTDETTPLIYTQEQTPSQADSDQDNSRAPPTEAHRPDSSTASDGAQETTKIASIGSSPKTTEASAQTTSVGDVTEAPSIPEQASSETTTEQIPRSVSTAGPTSKQPAAATVDTLLPDVVDPSENDIDPPSKPPLEKRQGGGGGYVISDAR